MKNALILLLSIFLFSCSNEPDCQSCKLITSSNEKEASFKCKGLANSYPRMDILAEQDLGELCDDEIKEAEKANSTVVVKNNCSLDVTTMVEVICN